MEISKGEIKRVSEFNVIPSSIYGKNTLYSRKKRYKDKILK